MARNAYYTHLDGQHYPCEILERTETLAKVRLSEETAKELRLPKNVVKAEGR